MPSSGIESFSEIWEESDEVNEYEPTVSSTGLLTQHLSSKDYCDSSENSDDGRSQDYPTINSQRKDSGEKDDDDMSARESEDPESPTQIFSESHDSLSFNQNSLGKIMMNADMKCTTGFSSSQHEINSIQNAREGKNQAFVLHGTNGILKGFTEDDHDEKNSVGGDAKDDNSMTRNTNRLEEEKVMGEIDKTQATQFSITSGDTLQVPSQFIPMILMRHAKTATDIGEDQEKMERVSPHHTTMPTSMKSMDQIFSDSEHESLIMGHSAAVNNMEMDTNTTTTIRTDVKLLSDIADTDMLNVGNTDMAAESERHNSVETSSQHLETNVKDSSPLLQESSVLQGTKQDIEPKEPFNLHDKNYFDDETQLFIPNHIHRTMSSDTGKTLTASQLFSYPLLDPMTETTTTLQRDTDKVTESMIESSLQSKVSFPSSLPNDNKKDANDDERMFDAASFDDSTHDMDRTFDHPTRLIQGINQAPEKSSTNWHLESMSDDIEEFETSKEKDRYSDIDENRKSSNREAKVGSPQMTKPGSATRVVSVSTGIARNSAATFHAEEVDSDDSDGSEESEISIHNNFALSQRTETIQRQLGEFSEVNVDNVVRTLMRSPAADVTTLKLENDNLHLENSNLSRKNKELSRQIKALQQEVSRLNSSLDREKKISSAMKSELDRIQPLVKAAVEISNRVQSHAAQTFDADHNQSPPVDSSHSSNASKRKKVVIKDFDEDSSDDEGSRLKHKKSDTPRKALTFPSPKPPLPPKAKSSVAAKSDGHRGKDHKILKSSVVNHYKPQPNFNEIWRFLKSKGWSHKVGPEPYAEKVYVPPNGNVKIGAKIGIDFFHGHDLFKKAEEQGFQTTDYSSDSSDEVPISALKEKKILLDEDSVHLGLEKKGDDQISISSTDTDLDNTILCGPSKVVTLLSAKVCGRLLVDAAKCGEDLKFMRDLFKPLWNCLKDEQLDGWKYGRSVGPLSRTYFFIPPGGSAKGTLGKDFFTTEQSLVLFVLKEIRALDKKFLGGSSMDKDFKRLSNFLETKAIEEDSNAVYVVQTDQRRQRRGTQLVSDKTHGKSDNKVSHINAAERKRKKLESNDDAMCSSDNCHIATQEGVKILLDMRTTSRSESYRNRELEKDDETSHSSKGHAQQPPVKRNKVSSFHLSQTPESTAFHLPPQVTARKDESTLRERKPFDGLSFFASGLDESSYNQIRSLGGSILTELSGEVVNASNVTKKLFFVSEPTKRRTLKYILAGALGVPMLHKCWVAAIFDRFKSKQQPNVFDSALYSSYRLPLGLSTSSGLFTLQKARHAKKWCRPGCQDDGEPVFHGINIMIALENQDSEKKWSDILKATGANIIIYKGSVSSTQYDLILTDSISLPPHILMPATRISIPLNMAISHEKPIIDLSWATQCIVQRKRLDYTDEKYSLNSRLKEPRTPGATDQTQKLYSLKVDQVRYEIMDLVRFGRKSQSTIGRITAISYQKSSKKYKVQIQVMETQNDRELMDGGDCTAVVVDGSELAGHVVMLSGRDFDDISDGWGRETNFSDLFVQMKPRTES